MALTALAVLPVLNNKRLAQVKKEAADQEETSDSHPMKADEHKEIHSE